MAMESMSKRSDSFLTDEKRERPIQIVTYGRSELYSEQQDHAVSQPVSSPGTQEASVQSRLSSGGRLIIQRVPRGHRQSRDTRPRPGILGQGVQAQTRKCGFPPPKKNNVQIFIVCLQADTLGASSEFGSRGPGSDVGFVLWWGAGAKSN